MKKYFLFPLLLYYFFSTVEAQQVTINKDSLKIFGNGDTLYIYNTDSSELIIDSLYSVNPAYGYWLNIVTKDSSFLYYTAYHYENIPLEIKLAKSDTAKFVFEKVDLCTVCKRNSQSVYFQDTLKLLSNSKLNDTLSLYVEGDGTLSSVDNNKNLSLEYKLYQNYPNPFNPVTNIEFRIANSGFVSLKVYDLLGRDVATPVNEFKQPGSYSIKFNGGKLTSGMYIYRLEVNGFITAKKLFLVQ